MELGGKKRAVAVTHKIAWNAAGEDWTLFAVLAPEAEELNAAWLYCADGVFKWLYYETFGKLMTLEQASGSCSSVDQATKSQAILGKLTAMPGSSPFMNSIDIAADGAELHEGKGTTTWLGGMDITAYGYVDCLECPHSVYQNGWHEVHALFHSDKDQQCFGIFYLFPDDPGKVQLQYPYCFTDFSFPPATVFQSATWKIE